MARAWRWPSSIPVGGRATSGFRTWHVAFGPASRSIRQKSAPAVWSPDSTRIVYNAQRKGVERVLFSKMSNGSSEVPGPGGQVAGVGSRWLIPEMARRGRELFNLAPDGAMMSVAVDGTTAAFRAEAPRALFHAPLASFVGYRTR
ncbi:MAG TPA: hypothetical protein VKA59_13555 [Vicinamibacterales bacterium]|nr:hypothetical protein [Vicinamibacterales bacterium]